MEAALFEHACDGSHGRARNSEEMDVFGVRLSASQVCCSSKDKVKSARWMPAYENQNQPRGTMPFATQGKSSRYEPSQNRRQHVGAAKITSNRPAPEFRACLGHPTSDAPEHRMEA